VYRRVIPREPDPVITGQACEQQVGQGRRHGCRHEDSAFDTGKPGADTLQSGAWIFSSLAHGLSARSHTVAPNVRQRTEEAKTQRQDFASRPSVTE
jgi:hypothetical protein